MQRIRLAWLCGLLATAVQMPCVAQAVPEPAASAASAPRPSARLIAQRVAASPLGQCFRRLPAYPAQALRSEQEGETLVAFTIDAAGRAAAPALLRSSGHKILDEAALAHLEKCLAQHGEASTEALPAGRYALPMLWRLE
ncbi:MAG: TonB family protein [Burkholderiaceae bacterium]|nr:TonB family protein [Burkholderiaceae bacterium]